MCRRTLHDVEIDIFNRQNMDINLLRKQVSLISTQYMKIMLLYQQLML